MLECRTREKIQRNGSRHVFFNDDIKAFPESFAGFVQNFFDKTTSSMRRSDLVANPVHVVHLRISASFKWWLAQSG